jgi:hypothetical protein
MTEATFFVDLETGEIRSKVVRSVAPAIRVRFNTFLKCVIGFVRDEVAEALADGTGVTLVVKPELGHTEAAVALDVTANVTGDGAARRYEMQSLVTGNALSDLLNGLDEAVFSLQVAWGTEGAAGYGISEPLEIVVVNAYVRPGDELPDPTGDAAWELLKDTFPQGTPDEVERTLEFDVGGGGVTDHGGLSGLADDDHPQYLNNARGDARYAPIGAATGTNTGDVTLAGTPNYLTIVGQVITRALINLASHVTGILGVANGGTGLSSAGGAGNVLRSNGSAFVSSDQPATIQTLRIAGGNAGLLQTAVTGSGAATLLASNQGRSITTGTTANSAARHAWNNGGINNQAFCFHNVSGVDNRVVPFARPVDVSWRIQLSAWNASTNGRARFYFGVPQQIGTALANRGIGFEINASRQVQIVAHDGTTLTTSGVVATLTVSSSAFTLLRVRSDGAGNVSLYLDEVLVGTTTGGPTTSGVLNACGIHAEVNNGADAAANTIITGDMTLTVY